MIGGDNKVTKTQLLKVIDELQTNPNDRMRILGDLGISVVGAGLGTAAAGTIAAIVGTTSIPALTTAASWIGISALAATPIGWTLGIAAAGGALAYGISRLIRNGGLSEGRKSELLQAYQDRLREIQFKERAASISPSDRNQFITSLRELIEKDAIPPKKAFQLIEAVERGAMPISQAYKLVSAILCR
jgi:hypothetical protein